jgi:molybdenum cofactor biosynthesis enzyme
MKKVLAGITAVALFAVASPAFASNSSDVDILVKNDDTTVKNYVTTVADTGSNMSVGGGASTSVSGGNVNHSDDKNTAGNGGGNTSNGGNGGSVTTGNATATSGVVNDVNSTLIKVAPKCGCKGKIKVEVSNDDTYVKNKVTTVADTGSNMSVGGGASTSVSGGNVNHSDDKNTAGNGGGNTSTGGNGSSITTGAADSTSFVSSVVNSTVIRVKKN